MTDKKLSREQLLKIERSLKEVETRKKFDKLAFYHPYPKQAEFHMLGASKRERLLMAGNQNGKTFCGGAEVAMHLTGRYSKDWKGRRWDRPTRGWVAGVTGESTRDNPQRILLGTLATGYGTGSIPRECLGEMKLARGVADLYDTILVKHESGGWSEMKFKSYERGREKWQGDTLDWIWYDEEPPMPIYTEGLARISATSGMVFVTFTPLQGMSSVVLRYLNEPSPDRAVVTMTIDDAEHIDPAERQKIIDGYPEHEREARANGSPMLGKGRIFPYTEASVKCEPFEIPGYWAKLWGVDFGTGHPFGAVLLNWDRDADVVYISHCIKLVDKLPIDHWAAMKPHGERVPIAWPQDGHARRDDGKGELKSLRKIYKDLGAKMLPDHARFASGDRSTEAGLVEMAQRIRSGRLKVFSTCPVWFDEYRLYHRGEDGLIVKQNDDIMSATRIGIMDLRHARVLLTPSGGGANMAKDVDFDLF